MLIQWTSSTLSALDAMTLHQVYKLRQNVFILEQRCLYADIDALDEQAIHMLGVDADQQLVAYLRILQPGVQYTEPAIGRVVVAPVARGTGLGRELIVAGVNLTHQHYPNANIRLSAQSHLVALYESVGFVSVGESYLEDDIPHQEMLLTQNQ